MIKRSVSIDVLRGLAMVFMALVIAYHTIGPAFDWDIANNPSPGYGLSLGWVYVLWVFVVASLYPACRWFSGVKKRTKHPLLSYL